MKLERMTLGPLAGLASGTGPPLFYLGGLLPVAGVDDSLARSSAEFSLRPFADIRRAIYTNRRRGLPEGANIADIAAEHAAAIDALDCGSVDVVGTSTGGSIAQQLAADHPEAVRRLVLVSTGCRLSLKTQRMQARVAREVRAGNQRRAVASLMIGILFPGDRAFAPLLAPLVSPLAKRVGDLSDLATTIEVEEDFDLARCDHTIAAPTVIIAGARDRFYPPSLLEETQRLIPGSTLHVIPRRGHLTVMTHPHLIAIAREHLQQ
ncbi:MAG: alpha/beta fold hydrolase [Gaiellaceae bacterium]